MQTKNLGPSSSTQQIRWLLLWWGWRRDQPRSQWSCLSFLCSTLTVVEKVVEVGLVWFLSCPWVNLKWWVIGSCVVQFDKLPRMNWSHPDCMVDSVGATAGTTTADERQTRDWQSQHMSFEILMIPDFM